MQHQLIVDKIAMQPKFPNKLSSEQNTYNINTYYNSIEGQKIISCNYFIQN